MNEYDHKSGANVMTLPMDYTAEHQKVRSRLTGEEHEIGFGPLPAAANPSLGGQVPINPFVSQAQAGYLHMHPQILGPKRLKEWDEATKGHHLPKRVKK